MSTLIDSLAVSLDKALATDATGSSFSALVMTTTTPTNSATRRVYDFRRLPGQARNRYLMRVWPYGGNNDGDQIKVKVVGWARVTPPPNQPGPAVDLWAPALVTEVLATLSSALTGVAGQAVPNTQFLADTLSSTSGNNVLTQGTGDVDPASFVCDTGGYELVEVIPICGTGGDAANALIGWE